MDLDLGVGLADPPAKKKQSDLTYESEPASDLTTATQ